MDIPAPSRRPLSVTLSGGWALGISCLLHLSIFFLVVLSFTGRPMPRRPVFIFLGSILESQELAPLAKHKTPAELPITPGDKVPFQKTHFDPVQITAVPKPSFPAELQPKEKIFSKIHFLDKSNNDNSLYKKWNIKRPLPRIVPLRLYRK